MEQAQTARRTVSEIAGRGVGTGTLIGYAWVTTRDQSLGRQIDALAAVGCGRIFADSKPGKNTEYPELRRLLDYACPGDALVVASLGRLSRSLQDLIPLVAELRWRGLELMALHEKLDTTTSGGQLIFHVFAALAEFLRENIADGTGEGLGAARARSRPGRPTVMTAEKIAAARVLLPKNSITAVARQIGVSRGTLYAHMDALTAGR